MKTASKVLRFVGLGFSILCLILWALCCFDTLCSFAIFLIPVIGWIFGLFVIIYCILILPIGLLMIYSISGMVFSTIVSIRAVVKSAKNKHTVTTGVMMIVTALFIGIGTIAFLIPVVAGVCLILSAIFAKKAEEKEQQADE